LFSPGGRLCLDPNVPVPNADATSTTLYYSPYAHAYIPIFDGTAWQVKQFTSGPTSNTGLTLSLTSAAWPASTLFDVFATLIGGAPVLCTVQWSTLGARATQLVFHGGIPVNAAACPATRAGPTSFTLPAYQGAYLGTFSGGGGNVVIGFGTSAAGGVNVSFLLYNYWNQVLFKIYSVDTTTSYVYNGGYRPVGGSVAFLQGTQERQAHFNYWSTQRVGDVANNFMQLGISYLPSPYTTWYAIKAGIYQQPWNAGGYVFSTDLNLDFSLLGWNAFAGGEATDGNSAQFNWQANNQITASFWA
jgi:hypothetical protein